MGAPSWSCYRGSGGKLAQPSQCSPKLSRVMVAPERSPITLTLGREGQVGAEPLSLGWMGGWEGARRENKINMVRGSGWTQAITTTLVVLTRCF